MNSLENIAESNTQSDQKIPDIKENKKTEDILNQLSGSSKSEKDNDTIKDPNLLQNSDQKPLENEIKKENKIETEIKKEKKIENENNKEKNSREILNSLFPTAGQVQNNEFEEDNNKKLHIDTNFDRNDKKTPHSPKEPKTPRSPRPSSTKFSPRNSPRPTININKEAASLIAEKFIKGVEVKESDPHLLIAAMIEIETTRNELMSKGHFKESLKTQKALETARSAQITASKKIAQEHELLNVQQKQSEAKTKINSISQQIKQSEQELLTKFQEQIDSMLKRHEFDIIEHDSKWESDSKRRQFNRSSNQLRTLRVQQQLLMKAKRFDEAEYVCKNADLLEQQESNRAAKLMQTAYNNSKNNLLKRHQEEIETLKKAQNMKKEEIKCLLESKVVPLQNRIKVLAQEEELAKNPDYVWATKHRNDDDQALIVGQQVKTGRNANTTRLSDFTILPLPPLKLISSPNKIKEKSSTLN